MSTLHDAAQNTDLQPAWPLKPGESVLVDLRQAAENKIGQALWDRGCARPGPMRC